MKICSICKKYKVKSKFYKNKSRKDGFTYECKKCFDKKRYNYLKNNTWARILFSIRRRCNNIKQDNYKYYGNRGIKSLLTIKEIKFLWYRDKAYNMIKPSIDRKNSMKNYTLGNCRFIEVRYNIRGKGYKNLTN